MQGYACGFLFSVDRSRVLLIRKRRPAWQAGRLNGIGGKIEQGETPAQAMRREFWEEAGLDVDSFREVLVLTGPDWRGHFFRTFGDVDAARSVTDEQIEIHGVRPLPPDVIPNLHWIVAMMLDEDPVNGTYRVDVIGGAETFGAGERRES